jgi:hypothetical protein
MDLETLQRLYSEQEKNKAGGLQPEEVLAMDALGRRLAALDLDAVIKRKLNNRPEMTKAIEKKLEGAINRKRKKRGPGRPKVHWKTKDRRRRQYRVEVATPRRWAKEAEQWKTGEGWFAYMSKQWRQNKYPVELTLEQWLEHVYPKVEGRVFTVQRYIKKEPIRLDNLLILSTENQSVLFDGKEFALEQAGYCQR